MSEIVKPYVVSADTYRLLSDWAESKAVTLPSQTYFEDQQADLKDTLSTYFEAVDMVPENDLFVGMNKLIAKSQSPVVSLDRVYVDSNQKNLAGFLDATRTVNKQLQNTGLGSRFSATSLEKQISLLANQFQGRQLVLADDVIFEGKTLLGIINNLREQGVTIGTVLAGIAVKEGIDLLAQNQIEVRAVFEYDQVIDEVCERDFRVGVPYSGRTIVNESNNEGVPYFSPFGQPVEWASIPATEAFTFSLFCLSQALALWTETERLSRREILTQEVAKPVRGLPKNTSMSQAIKQTLSSMQEGIYEPRS